MIKIDNINIERRKKIITNSSITIPDNKITVITGPSGSGKSMLLYVIGLLTQYPDIKYTFDDIVLDALSSTQLENFKRNNISFVLQDDNLIEHASIYDNFKVMSYMFNTPSDEETCLELLNKFNLPDNLNQPVNELSRGQRQRLAILLAFIKKPSLLILDEPTSFLDKNNEDNIMMILKDLIATTPIKIVIASHSKNLIAASDVVYHIQDTHLYNDSELITVDTITNKKTNYYNKHFLFYYSYLYIKHHFQTYLKIGILITIAALAFMVKDTVSSIYMDRQIMDFNEQTDNMLLMSRKQGISSDLLEELDSLDSIKNYYFNTTIPVLYQNKIALADIIYPEQKHIIDTTGIYIQEGFNPNIGYMTYINNDPVELSVVGTIPLNYVDPIRRTKSEVWIPYELIKDINRSTDTIVIFANSIVDVIDLETSLSDKYPSYTIYPLAQGIPMVKRTLEDLAKLSTLFSIVLIVVCSILCYGIFAQLYRDRRLELQLLRVYGVNKKTIFKLILFEVILFLVLCTVLVYFILMLINMNTGSYDFYASLIYMWGYVLIITVWIAQEIMNNNVVETLRG